MKVPEKIPDWLAVLPGNALLTTKDMYKMFGYKTHHVMTTSIHNNRASVQFPCPDLEGRIFIEAKDWVRQNAGHNRTLRWKASTIRNFIRHVNRNTAK